MSLDSQRKPVEPDLGDFDSAREIRLKVSGQLTMRKRLEQLHYLCLQMSQIKNVASR